MNETKKIVQELNTVPYAKKIRILQELCHKYEHKSDDDFLHYGQMLLLIIRNSDITPGTCDICNVVSKKLYNNNIYLKALKYANDALAYCEKINYSKGLAKSYSNISLIQTVLNNFQAALDAEFTSLRVNEHLIDKNAISENYFKIGVIYSNIKNYDSALDFFQKSLQLKIELDDHKGIIKTYQNLSLIYIQIDRLDEAAKYGEKLLIIGQQHNDRAGIGIAYKNLGMIFQQKDEFNKAIDYHKKSLVIYEQIGASFEIGNSLYNIGNCYLKTNNYDYAINHFLKALEIIKKTDNIDAISDLTSQLATCYKQLNDYEKAYKYYMKYSNLRNQILIKKNQNQITALQAEFEIVKKNKDNKISHLKNVELAKANALNDKIFTILSRDLQDPFTAINSNLNLIKRNSEDHDFSNISKQLNQLDQYVKPSMFLLQNLIIWAKFHNKDIQFKPKKLILNNLVNEVITTLTNNIKLKKITVDNWISESLTINSDENILKAILQNFLNNAIKFSYLHGKIVFNVREKGDFVEISIKDSGIGMSREQMSGVFEIGSNKPHPGTAMEKGSGLGLALCSDLSALCNGRIEVESVKNKGTVFTITIPKEKK